MKLEGAYDAMVTAGFSPVQAATIIFSFRDVVTGRANAQEMRERCQAVGFSAQEAEALASGAGAAVR